MGAGLSNVRSDHAETERCSVWVPRWVSTAGAGHARMTAEDKQMRDGFGEEWVCYTTKVRSRFVPGLVQITESLGIGWRFPCFPLPPT